MKSEKWQRNLYKAWREIINNANAVVIGGGFGGIASALRLRAKGYSVTLVDQCERLGGRAQQYEKDGFVYDAGPTVVTAPFLFEELFELFDKQLSDYINLVPVEPWYRFVYPDGSTFDYGGTVEDTLAQIRAISEEDAQGYLNLLEQSNDIFEVGFTQLADQPFDKITTMLKQVPALIRLKCYRSVWQMVCAFLKHDKLRQAFSIQPLLVGGNPFSTTSIYSLIHFLERKWGVHFAMGGTAAMVNGFEQLMREEGIDIQLNTKVTGLEIANKNITAVVTEKGILSCDKVVSNVDPKHLYTKLVPRNEQNMGAKLKTKYASLSMGLFVLYFGTDKKYESVVHHTIWLGKRYQSLLDDIFDKKILADDFSLYLHRPTATDPSLAPEGCDSFYVLSPVPNNLSGIDWEQEKEAYADKVIKALEESIMPGLTQSLVHRIIKTPADFENDYSSVSGSGFSIAPTFTQSAWFRFHNKAEGPSNLYLAGAGTHPGAGLPGVLSSAKVVDKLIESSNA
ncbi:phytoene desaturase family protein [Glaciecola petra]|uniref:Phytoene dehydrogenase n=1 Tax=Glaciecola petra TaxID=3075602 RepID=A0ABU2ZQ60_9ALTE|nr:phytoene desaturase family protein [Aestuariibacter sp. P117]MDT0594747.1 phytoene desaturase family protein [Aestuariibacter sp. P117]